MIHYELDLDLLDDVVFSRRTATVGSHETLICVPGAALWGYVCARLYRERPLLADAVAYGNGAHFGDARPLGVDREPSWPVPLCWHVDKTRPDQPSTRNGWVQAEHVTNALHGSLSALGQARAMRDGYVTAHGQHLQPKRRYVLRTAIVGGRAAPAQLFGYESLMAGQGFRARISVIDETLRPEIERCFAEGSVIRIGRSKGSEYGRVRCKLREPHIPPPPTVAAGDSLTLWLLSDACLRDAHGRPLLSPDADALGLAGARLDPSRCFVRHNRYSSFNSHRNCHGVERQCISAGSVLTWIRAGHPFTAQELTALAGGIGEQRESGHGEVAVNPTMLADVRPILQPWAAQTFIAAVAAPVAGAPALPIVTQWADRRAQARRAKAIEDQRVAETLGTLARRLGMARRFRGVAEHLPCGPGRSQWGAFAQICRNASSASDLIPKLFGANGLLKAKNNPDWETGTDSDGTLASWLEAQATGWLADRKTPWLQAQHTLCRLADAAREAELHQWPQLGRTLSQQPADEALAS